MKTELPGRVEVWKLDKLKPYARNARIHPPGQVAQLVASIKEFGFLAPILVNLKRGTIIAGHGRFQAAAEAGLKEVRVIAFDHLTEAQERAYRLVDNQLALNADWDDSILAGELAALEGMKVDLDSLGFDGDEFARLLAPPVSGDEEKPDDVDTVPEPRPDPTSVVGDLWRLGDHRLFVGDSLVPENVTRLLSPDAAGAGGGLADLVFTDPPYNVDYEGYTDSKLTIASDNMSAADFKVFLRRTFQSYRRAVKGRASIYVCHPSSWQRQFQNALELAGFEVRCQIIWAKNTFAWGQGRYKFQHEPIFYGHVAGMKDRWFGDKTQATLWEVPKPSANRLHPTAKPVDLVERALENSSAAGDIVLDLFGGSGSTLIACERTLRKARLAELDPVYADGIVRRWQALTGEEAVHESGATFETVVAERQAAA